MTRAKIIFAIIAICVTAALAVLLVRNYLLEVGGVATSYSLVYAIGDYANAHGSRLPLSWDDFFEWQKSRGKAAFKKAEIEKRFNLAWGTKISAHSQKMITVNDIGLKNQEPYLNQTLQRMIEDK